MELTAQESAELKKIELRLFQSFLKVCEALHLRYYVVGGTLLGAVRHRGFIPWDDDIDLAMPREDYERFTAQGQAMLPADQFIQTWQTDAQWPAHFAKLRDENTTCVEISMKNRRIHHGVGIDIFPLDYYPDGRREQRRFDFWNLIYKMRIACVFHVPGGNNAKVRLLQLASRILCPRYEEALVKRESLLRAVPKSRMLANYCGAWGKREIVPAQWYGEGRMLQFEGISVRAPKEYEKWLEQVYGDYMQLPPLEKRVGHHDTYRFDLTQPYTAYGSEKA